MHRSAIAGLGKLIERADVASAAIELHRRQFASPARCGRLLAQTNPASAVMPTLPRADQTGGVSRIKRRLPTLAELSDTK